MKSSKLPLHLRRFTAAWLFTKMCSQGVDLLQRNKEYVEAVKLLHQLLGQSEFCPNHRGRWWERLALNLDQHLKKPAEVLFRTFGILHTISAPLLLISSFHNISDQLSFVSYYVSISSQPCFPHLLCKVYHLTSSDLFIS